MTREGRAREGRGALRDRGRVGRRATGRCAGLGLQDPGGARPPHHVTTATATVFAQLALRWGRSTISPAEFQAALSAEQNRWLKRTFIITDPILRSQIKHAETRASEAKAAAADAPPATKAEAEAEAQLQAAAAEAMRATVPEVHRDYGITG